MEVGGDHVGSKHKILLSEKLSRAPRFKDSAGVISLPYNTPSSTHTLYSGLTRSSGTPHAISKLLLLPSPKPSFFLFFPLVFLPFHEIINKHTQTPFPTTPFPRLILTRTRPQQEALIVFCEHFRGFFSREAASFGLRLKRRYF